MNPTVAGPRRMHSPTIAQGFLITALLSATVAGVLLAGEVTRLPSVVPRITVVNPTQYNVQIDVTGLSRDGWLSLGGVRRETTKHLYEVIDQGNRWIFHFHYAGQDAGELSMSKAELRAGDWRLSIPPGVGARLRAAGLTPSA